MDKNAKEWAEKIVETYNDINKMKRLEQEAHTLIRDNFTWDCLSNSFIEQYEKRGK